MNCQYRNAEAADAEAIAQLHADSWRRTYRGMYRDEFLDGDLVGERLGVWRERLEHAALNQFVSLAITDERLAGFVCAYGAEDHVWGSLIDNLHVASDARRQRIGAALMRQAAVWFGSSYADRGVYLWVFEANRVARDFYESIGGTNAETMDTELQVGGRGIVCRYVWPSPAVLAERTSIA